MHGPARNFLGQPNTFLATAQVQQLRGTFQKRESVFLLDESGGQLLLYAPAVGFARMPAAEIDVYLKDVKPIVISHAGGEVGKVTCTFEVARFTPKNWKLLGDHDGFGFFEHYWRTSLRGVAREPWRLKKNRCSRADASDSDED
jgi:hypothetical protein